MHKINICYQLVLYQRDVPLYAEKVRKKIAREEEAFCKKEKGSKSFLGHPFL